MAEDRPRNVLLFDLDGTLVDSAPAIAQALSQISIGRGGAKLDVDAVRRLVSQGVETLVASTLGTAGRDLADDIAQFRMTLQRLPAEPGWLYPDVAWALAALAESSFKLAVVTNKPEHMSRQLLQGLDLDRYFGTVVGGDTVATMKPDPAPALHALSVLGSSVEQAIFVGDSAPDAAVSVALSLPFVLHAGGYDPLSCAAFPLAASFLKFAELPQLCIRLRAGLLASSSVGGSFKRADVLRH